MSEGTPKDAASLDGRSKNAAPQRGRQAAGYQPRRPEASTNGGEGQEPTPAAARDAGLKKPGIRVEASHRRSVQAAADAFREEGRRPSGKVIINLSQALIASIF
jgi:hypothetical protein